MALFVAAVTSGCADQSAMRLTADTIKLRASTAPIYGSAEPERRIMRMAADETIKAGYDKFQIVAGGSTSLHRNVLGQTGGYAQVTPTQATYVGPQTVAAPRFENEVIIKMFKAGDPAGANAIEARSLLAQKE